MPSYRVEESPNGRARCKANTCGKDKILKDEIRFGTWVEIQDRGSWAWRHWGCITAQVLKNVANALKEDDDEDEYNWVMLDGLSDLNDENQTKIKRVVEQGYVDDEDWKGEEGKNHPGAGRSKKKAADDGDEEPAEKPKAKRGRKKAKDDDDDAGPAPTQTTGRSGKKAAVKGAEETKEPAKKRGSVAKARAKEEVDPVTTETPKKRGRTKKDEKTEAEEQPGPSKKRGRKAREAEPGSDKEAEEAGEKKPARRGRPAKAKGSDAEEEPKKAPAKRAKTSKKATEETLAGDEEPKRDHKSKTQKANEKDTGTKSKGKKAEEKPTSNKRKVSGEAKGPGNVTLQVQDEEPARKKRSRPSKKDQTAEQ